MSMHTISAATAADIPQLLPLVNSAYRGEGSKKGWTTEADLIEGELRIDAAGLEQLINKPGAVVRKYTTGNSITGCVYLEAQGQELYLGMLSVSPEAQATGIGKTLLMDAEQYAQQQGFSAIAMQVISLRTELIDWYIRRGYALTGETRPFPTDNRFGTPVQALQFVILKKKIR